MQKEIKMLTSQRLVDMTGKELLELLYQVNPISAKQEIAAEQLKGFPDIPPLVTGIKDVARVLGISQSTVSRWKESGEIDDCVYQSGKTVIFDTHKILEKLRLSNRKWKYEKFKSNQQIMEHVSEKALIEIVGDLSLEDKEFCEKETKQILELLSPKQFAALLLEAVTVIDLFGAEQASEIVVGRLVMNRKPKNKSVNVLAETILDVGMLVMLLAIPATVARHFGYEIEDFNGNPIPEDKLCVTVVIIDGQTRYLAIRKLREKYPSLVLSNVYAYFPLHWVGLTKMLQAINLKVFTWTNSDFISGLRGVGLKPEVEKALAYIQSLEQRGYNFTAACEWGTLLKGIIRKSLLVRAMNKPDINLEYENSEYGMDIHQEARKVFSGKNEYSSRSQESFLRQE